MKPFLTLLLFFSFLFFSSQSKAQSFEDFQSLIENLGEDQRNDFFEQLQQLDVDVLGDYLQENGALEKLLEMLNGDLPFDEFNDLAGIFENAGIYLEDLLINTFGLSDEDQEILLTQFDNVEDAFLNAGSFQNVFNENQDSLGNDIPLIQIPDDLNIDPLVENFGDALDEFDVNNTSSLQNIFNEIFSASLINSLEVAYGRKSAIVDWYGNSTPIGMDDLQVLRVGTVPSFDSDFEPYWSFVTSWSDNQFGLVTGYESTIQEDRFNPFVVEGDFGIMYNPGVEVLGVTNGRLITRLGFEVGSYMPRQLIAGNESTYNNVGRTTGCGPQIATGYVVNTGNLSTYVMASASYGVVSNSPDPYAYTSLKLEAGARFGNAVNVRYSVGQQDWANGNNKRVTTLQQITIGIIVDELFN